jgi:hypothetical protein
MLRSDGKGKADGVVDVGVNLIYVKIRSTSLLVVFIQG